jgi:hypothetical protein
MVPIPTRLCTLQAKLESTLGTAATMGNGDAGFRVMNAACYPTGSSAVIPAGTGNGDIGAVAGVYAGVLNFDIELYEGKWAGILLPSCGWPQQSTSGQYSFCDVTNGTNSWQGLSAGLYYTTNKKYGLLGAMGSFSMRMSAGLPIIGSFRYMGVYNANPGSVPTPTWETSLPPIFNSLTIDGDSTIALPTVEIVPDPYAFLIPQPNSQGAIVNAWLRKPNYRIRLSPFTTSATDWISEWLANGTTHTFTAVANAGANNTITVTATMGHVTAPGHDEQDEQLKTPLEFAVLNNSLQIAFT